MTLFTPPLISLSQALPAQPDPQNAAPLHLNSDNRSIGQPPRNSGESAGLIPIPAPGSSRLSFLSVLLPPGSLPRPIDPSHVLDLSPSSSHQQDSLLASHYLPGNGSNPADMQLAALLLLNLASLGRRMRSGSLFLTNSIWNDDAVLAHLPLHTLTLGVLDVFHESTGLALNPLLQFLSPTLGAQPSLFSGANPTRNRSHTTTGAGHSGLGSLHGLDTTRLALLPFLNSAKNDASLLLDNLVLNLSDGPGQATRNRSQTYSGVKPVISDLPLVGNHMLTMQGLAPIQNSYSNSGHQSTLPNQPQGLQNQQHGQQQTFPHHMGDFSLGGPLTQPVLQNDFDLSTVVITTNFENPSLGPTSTLLFDNLPHFVDAASLYQLLNNSAGAIGGLHYRGVSSVRISSMPSSKMALVDCSSIEVAMGIKANFNHLEIVPGVILYVAFARLADQNRNQLVPDSISKGPNSSQPARLPNVKQNSAGSLRLNSSHSDGSYTMARNSVDAKSPASPQDLESSLVNCVSRLSMMQSIDINKVRSLIRSSAKFPKSKYQSNFGPLPDPIPLRQFDSPKLRELRKTLENNERALQSTNRQSPQENEGESKLMSQLEIEELALAMLEELPELCHDHIGNTIVQKIFTVIESPLIKLIMVKEIAPYLTQLGIHKNGTWAIQKIINLCQEDYQQKQIIADSLKPYAVKLFNDQFGNYVLQCCLKFGTPFNDFIFETMLDNFLEISSGRFGARCIRTILETANDGKNNGKNAVSNEQLFLVASLIVENANELVVNSNGSLLVTWFLDTFSGCRGLENDNRYELLSEKFMPHLDKLCAHKLANLTIFKLLNNRTDYRVKQALMDSIFGPYSEFGEDDLGMRPPSPLLEAILLENQEHNAGPLFIYKILSNPILLKVGDEASNARYLQFVTYKVKRVLLEMNIMNLQPYKKLVDEVGLSTNRLGRSSSTRKNKRGNSRNGKAHSPRHQPYLSQIPLGAPLPPPMGYIGQANNGGYAAYQPAGNLYATGGNVAMQPPMNHENGQYVSQQRFQQEMTVMQQLEQLSLSSAALGYTSNPGTPLDAPNQKGQFF